ncbi:hypothetical protein [Burkholderia sp. AU30280]|uniref:hypothetical protein n=1 Tax=Burkholderia sp. AU30280 TaxID=2879628 RepID=UPI0039A67374
MSQPIIGDELRIRMELLLQPSRLRFGKSPGPPACFDSADTLSAPIPGCITSAALCIRFEHRANIRRALIKLGGNPICWNTLRRTDRHL